MTNKFISLLLCSIVLVSTSNAMNIINNPIQENSIQEISSVDMGTFENKLNGYKSELYSLNNNINVNIDNINVLKKNVIDIYKDFIELKPNDKNEKKKLPGIKDDVIKYTNAVKLLLEKYGNNQEGKGNMIL